MSSKTGLHIFDLDLKVHNSILNQELSLQSTHHRQSLY